jgi:hypothetical protein
MDQRLVTELVDAATRLLGPHLERNADLRTLVHRAALLLADLAERSGPVPPASGVKTAPTAPAAPEAPDAAPSLPAPSPAPPPAPLQPVVRTKTALVPLKIGDAVMHVRTEGTTQELGRARQAAGLNEADEAEPDSSLAPADLSLLPARCALKAESCRLAARRRGATDMDESMRLKGEMDAQIARAKSIPGCFLWAFFRDKPLPDDAALERIAGCYQALGEAAALMLHADDPSLATDEETGKSCAALLAEASSALRVALDRTWLTKPDTDQDHAHAWLRTQTFSRRWYLDRHMTLSDAADPGAWTDLLARIRHAEQAIRDRADGFKRVRSKINTMTYHVRRLSGGPPGEDAAHDRDKITRTLDELAAIGLPYTDARITQALRPAADALAALADNHAGLNAALAAVRSRQAADAADQDGEAASRAYSPAVARVAALVGPRRIVVIGGERRPQAVERLEAAFAPAVIEWVELTEHGPGQPMRAPIQRDDTALVVVIIRLTGHLHVDEAKACADAAGRPCVLLPAGYGVEQIAAAVLDQASDRLTPAVAG